MMRARTGIVVVALAVAGAAAPVTAQEGCAPAEHAGGDWPMYGQNLAGARHQAAETTIGPVEAPNLAKGWSVVSTSIGGGQYHSTPVVANGCVYIGSNNGNVIALNADTGALVWRATLAAQPAGGNGGAIVGSVAYHEGSILVLVNQMFAPYAVSLDANTGEEQWLTVVDTDETGDYANASPVIYDDLLFYAISGPDVGDDYDPNAHQRYYVLDVHTGEVLADPYIIPQEDFERGHRGGSIWATPVVDEATGYLYVGTGNPVSKKFEHEYDNAILKIDLNRGSQTFAQIVDAYKGESDNYVEQLYGQPACEAFGDDPRLGYLGGYSLTCVQLDVDFGASPNLWKDASGRTIVGEFQKSGVFHAAYGSHLQPKWRSTISVPQAIGNSGTSATDGDAVYVGANPGVVAALDTETGVPEWVSATGDGVRYQAVSVANGVVYTVDTAGSFDAFDAATGTPLLHRLVRLDSGDTTTALSSSGVAIARNTVYVAINRSLVAYRI